MCPAWRLKIVRKNDRPHSVLSQFWLASRRRHDFLQSICIPIGTPIVSHSAPPSTPWMNNLAGRLQKSARCSSLSLSTRIIPRTRPLANTATLIVPLFCRYRYSTETTSSVTAQDPTMGGKPKFELKTPKGTKDCALLHNASAQLG